MRFVRVLFLASMVGVLTGISPAFKSSLAQAQSLGLVSAESGYQDDEEYDEEYDDSTEQPLPYSADPDDEQIDEWMDDGAVPDAADFLLMT